MSLKALVTGVAAAYIVVGLAVAPASFAYTSNVNSGTHHSQKLPMGPGNSSQGQSSFNSNSNSKSWSEGNKNWSQGHQVGGSTKYDGSSGQSSQYRQSGQSWKKHHQNSG